MVETESEKMPGEGFTALFKLERTIYTGSESELIITVELQTFTDQCMHMAVQYIF